MLFFWFNLSAQNLTVYQDTLHIHINFRQGYSSVDSSYCDNRAQLDSLVTLLNGAVGDSLSIVRSVTVKGCASPEGYTSWNHTLSEKRARNVRAYILEKVSLADSVVHVGPSDVGWELLSEMIAASDQPWRDEAVEIIANTPIWIFEEGRIVDGRKNRLCMLRGGRAWRYMSEHFFPVLRNTRFQIIYEKELLHKPLVEAKEGVADGNVFKMEKQETDLVTADTLMLEPENGAVHDAHARISGEAFADSRVETELRETGKEQARKERGRGLLLKTNLLYDAVTVPNVGLEVPLGTVWSVGANWMYAWWSNGAKHRYLRTYGGDVELRRWFSPKHRSRTWMCGHHVGVYGQMLTYDVEWGGMGYQGDRWTWAVGLSYGYSLPVGKHFNIDFTLGVGYLQGDYMKYNPQDDCYVWDSTHGRKWFGPTKAEISLVWFIGGRYERKGGAR
jgi:hypothetical protein